MSFVDFDGKEVVFRIVYFGPASSGKSECVTYIDGEIPDDARAAEGALGGYGDRELFFEYLPLIAEALEGFRTRFELYTLPSDSGYGMTRRLLLKGVDGLVFIADSCWGRMSENVESYESVKRMLAEQGDSIEDIPCLLQFNKTDRSDAAPADFLDFLFNGSGERKVSIATDALSGAGIFDGLNIVAKMVVIDFASRKSRDLNLGEVVLKGMRRRDERGLSAGITG